MGEIMIREHGPRKALEIGITEYLDEHYPLWQGDSSRVPEGMTVEMHPGTRMMILRDPDTASMSPDRFGKLWLPTTVSMDLEPGQWRLVMITKEVKTGGMLSDR